MKISTRFSIKSFSFRNIILQLRAWSVSYLVFFAHTGLKRPIGILGFGSSLDSFYLPLPALFYVLKIAVIKKK